jgi:hypothetical protein
MAHSRHNQAKSYSRRRVHREFGTIAEQTVEADRSLVDRTQQTVIKAIAAMDDRELVGPPERERESGWVRAHLDVIVVGIGAAVVGWVTGYILGSNAAPDVRPPAVEVSAPPSISTTSQITPNPFPLPGPTSIRPGG